MTLVKMKMDPPRALAVWADLEVWIRTTLRISLCSLEVEVEVAGVAPSAAGEMVEATTSTLADLAVLPSASSHDIYLFILSSLQSVICAQRTCL